MSVEKMGDTPERRPASEGREASRRRVRVRPRRLLARGTSSPGHDGIEGRFERLQAEIMLLREENAHLKAMEQQPAELGRMLTRVREVSARQSEHDPSDDMMTALAEHTVMRETLLSVCEEIERMMASVRGRLDSLGDAAAIMRALGQAEVSGGASDRSSCVESVPAAIRLIRPDTRGSGAAEDAR